LVTRSAFSDEVLEWLLSMHFDCLIQEDRQSFIYQVEIKKNGQYLLCLRFRDLNSQSTPENVSASEIAELYAEQSSLRAAGIAVVTLWEDVWYAKKEIVKSRISAILGISQRIPGRVTEARKIDRPTAADFLEENHLQGVVSSKIRYGLFLPERYYRVLDADYQMDRTAKECLVAVATFSHPRTFEREGNPFRSYELTRFANLKNTTVVGGFDKLLHAFTSDYLPGDIMTYADLEWSDGASYRRLGFEAVSDKGPICFRVDPLTNTRYPENRASGHDKLIKVYNEGSRKFVRDIR
jgi:hypothetical protein